MVTLHPLSLLMKSRSIRAALVAAALAGVPSAALAGHDRDRDDDRGRDRRDWRDGRSYDRGGRYERDRDDDRWRGGVGISSRTGSGYCPPPAPICPPPPRPIVICPPPVVEQRVWVPAVYRAVTDRRWVEPVYRTVVDRVWVEPVVQRVADRVWVPEKYEYRDAIVNGRPERQLVMVEPGHYADGPPRDVVVTPGHYEDRGRQEQVCAGRWETVTREELVSPAHWEVRPVLAVAAPVAAPCPPPARQASHARIDVRLPMRW